MSTKPERFSSALRGFCASSVSRIRRERKKFRSCAVNGPDSAVSTRLLAGSPVRLIQPDRGLQAHYLKALGRILRTTPALMGFRLAQLLE